MAKSETVLIRQLRKANEQYRQRHRQEKIQDKREARQQGRENAQYRQMYEQAQDKIGQLNQRLDFERGFWPVTWNDKRHTAENAAFMHRLEVLDDIIIGSESLQATTSLNLRQFEYILNLYTEKAKKHTECPPVF